MASMINCPYCGKLTDPKLEGCPHCGGRLQATAAPGRVAGRSRQTCPSCKAMIQEGDIICVVCGTNLLTGQKISAELKTVTNRSRQTFWLAAGGISGAVLLVAGLIGGYLLTRDPVRQAQKLVANNQSLEAINVLSAHVEGHADDARAWELLADLEWGANQSSKAAAAFERVFDLDPLNIDAAYNALAALGAQGPGQLDRQIGLLGRVVSANPDATHAWYLLALAQGGKGDTAAQISALERVIALEPGDPRAHWGLGIGMALEGSYDRAAEEIGAGGAGVSPGNRLASEGFVASLRGDDENAVRKLGEAAGDETLAVRAGTLTQLGKLLSEQGRFEEAEPHLREAQALDKRNPAVNYLLAICLKGQGLQQDALSLFEEISNEPSGPHTLGATVQAAEIYLSLNNLDRAQSTIERATQQGGGDAAFLTVRGRLYSARDNLAEAQNSFKRAVGIDPNYAPAYLENGLLYMKRESMAEGLREFEKYLELIGPEANSPQGAQIQELVQQLRQTTGEAPSA